MQLLVVALFGSAIFNNSFFRFGLGSLNVLSLFIIFCGATYLAMHFYNRKHAKKYKSANSCDKFLWAFFVVGAISVAGSYSGFYESITSNNIIYNMSYIPRQAYYLFFIPLIVLAGRHVQTPSILRFLQNNYIILFFFTWCSYIVINQTIKLDVPCFFCLSTLLLMGRDSKRVIDIVMLLIIELSPIDTGGEMTQLVCRMLCLFLFFARENGRFLRPMTTFAVLIILTCYVLPFVSLDSIGLDANTSWRLQYWGDEISQLIKTHGLGVGFGTSYATQSFIGEAISGPFAATSEYSVSERLYVVGCHNSFVSIAFRLGVFGVALLLLFILNCSRRALPEDRSNYLTYSSISSLAVICFNVGFESPMYFFLFAFAFAALGAMSSNPTIACLRNQEDKCRHY